MNSNRKETIMTDDEPTPGHIWVKSSLSYANGNCVEVSGLPGGAVGVRNSSNPDGPVLRFTADEWRDFIGGVRNGEFDGFGGASPEVTP